MSSICMMMSVIFCDWVWISLHGGDHVAHHAYRLRYCTLLASCASNGGTLGVVGVVLHRDGQLLPSTRPSPAGWTPASVRRARSSVPPAITT